MTRYIFVALLLFTAPAAAQEPLTFKGFELGADKEAFLAALPPASICREDRCTWTAERCSGWEKQCSYGGVVPELIGATFKDGKLATVIVFMPSSKFDELASAMRERFGKPARDEESTIQNRMGASFDNRKLRWIRSGVWLDLTKRAGKIDRCTVFLTSEQHAMEAAEKRKADAKARAKDL